MSDKIVGLRGEPVHVPGEVNEDTVELLEVLLADAKAGKLCAITTVSNYTDGVRYVTVGVRIGFSLLGGLEMARQGLINMLMAGQ